MAKKRGGLVSVSNMMLKRDASARHLRRKAEKLGKRYPAEVNQVLNHLDSKERNK